MSKKKTHKALTIEFFELEVGRYFMFPEQDNDSFPVEFYGIVWLKISDDEIESTATFSHFDDPVYLGTTTDRVYPLPEGIIYPFE